LPSPCGTSTVALAAPPARAPSWSLQGSDDRLHRLEDFSGKAHVMVFVKGLSCAHCRRQLEALVARAEELDKLRVGIVFVSPDPLVDIKEALAGRTGRSPVPFAVLSDEPLTVFRQFGCVNEGAVHGTFLVDRTGTVRWHTTGETPFEDFAGLLEECRKLSR
jgi:peroxiredoxin